MPEATWVWNHVPSNAEITDALSQLPAWVGGDKKMSEYIEYVIPFTRFNKETGNKETRLYMQVHGRIKIFRDAHPDDADITEDLQFDWRTNPNDGSGWLVVHGKLHSTVFGTVYEAATASIGKGAKGVDATSPVENAVTSWRGRAIGAMGIGLIPGSGCTLEEIEEADKREKFVERREIGGDSGQSGADQEAMKLRIIEMLKSKCKNKNLEFEARLTELMVEDGKQIEGSAEETLKELDINDITVYLGKI